MPGFRAISQMSTGAVPAYYDAFKEDKQERETGIYSPTSKILWTSRAKKIGRNISLELTYEMTAPWAWEIHILLLFLYLVLILNLKHLLLTRTQCVVAFWLVVYGPLCCVISSPLVQPQRCLRFLTTKKILLQHLGASLLPVTSTWDVGLCRPHSWEAVSCRRNCRVGNVQDLPMGKGGDVFNKKHFFTVFWGDFDLIWQCRVLYSSEVEGSDSRSITLLQEWTRWLRTLVR